MIWKGESFLTIGDFMTKGIECCLTAEEARAFMAAYRAETPHADVNIGYLSGYYGEADRCRIQEWFGVVHPIRSTLAESAPAKDLKETA